MSPLAKSLEGRNSSLRTLGTPRITLSGGKVENFPVLKTFEV